MNGQKRKAIKAVHIRQAVILTLAFVMLCIFGAWGSGSSSGLISGKERENRLYPSEAEAVEMAGMLPLTCTPVGEWYQKEDGQGFSEELLTALQECVREGGMAAAIEAYRDDTLLIDVDTLLLLCPDYESLIAEQAEEQQIELSKEDILGGIVSIYRLELYDALLVGYSEWGGPWFLLKKTEEGYFASREFFHASADWEHCQTAMFADGQDGYCMLVRIQRDEEELLRLHYFTLREDWEERIGGTKWLLDRKGCYCYIREKKVKAVCSFFYLNANHPLTLEIRAYVEENAMLFADKMAEDDVIWGDETPAASGEERVKVTWETGECEEHSIDWRDEAVQTDYDNDGEPELFWRIEGWRNVLLTGEEGGYRADDVSLYGDIPVEWLWFAEFSGKTVTFEIVEPYGADCPLLAAYLVEGNKKTPILTCQLVYGKTVEIDDNEYAGENNFQVRQVMPLLAEPVKETGEQIAFQKKLTAWMRTAGGAVIEPLQAETPFSEEFLEFIREGAVWCLSGKLFSAYAAPYEVNTEKDLEEFNKKCEECNLHVYDCSMAYRWEAADGTLNYLAGETTDHGYSVGTLYWYRDDGEGLYEKEAITDFSDRYGSYCGVLSYGGRLYCVTVTANTWTQLLEINLIALGDAGEWENYCISFFYEAKEYEMLSLYETDTPLDDYVAEEAAAVYEACATYSFYEGQGEYGDMPKEVWREIKNRDFSYSRYWYMYSFNSAHNEYVPVDVDNDGELEYVSVYMVSGKRDTEGVEWNIYGWRNGVFTELIMDEAFLHCYADEDGGWGIAGELDQLWFKEIDGVTYVFTVEKLTLLDGFLMRARVIQDGKVQDVGAWLFRNTGVILQDIQEMGEYDSWLKA